VSLMLSSDQTAGMPVRLSVVGMPPAVTVGAGELASRRINGLLASESWRQVDGANRRTVYMNTTSRDDGMP
jgi:hypothetical protein